ncbi:Mitochondrial genome maintenance protein [Zancudomyces culisetae]|uniref:Mitochondrial genome maintenance protein MGM101 n=1 Tax=Zancudomyces culisetae TaxID=1213189 RepID=A0A1R1PLG1_ZANCU|nr:Mitochondrial genome maintenance protein [Zancudomyces culisetae]|eukprot:OMH81769.1 Mitochondrial genome maintenance protein [Zancudomyces culisetae]
MFGPVRFSVAKSGARFANLNFGAVAKIPAGVSRLAYSTGTSTTSSSSTVVKAQDKTKSAKTDKVENVEKGEFNFKPSEVSSLKNSAGTTVKEDWSEDYHGVSTQSFDQRVIDILMAPLENQDVEIKPVKQFTLV